jgi:hypothetical protein
LQKISQNTALVLESIFWLSATEETMQDVLGIEDLSVSQSELFKAIERWGEARIKAEKNHSCNDDELRAIIDSCLKRIRFMSMKVQEFAELSTSTNVLSIEEKYWILLAIVRNEPEYIPKTFNRGVSRHSRLSASAIICNTSYICCGTLANTALKFSVSHPVTLLGLEIDIDLSTRELRRVPIVFAPASSGFKFMGFTVSDDKGEIVAVGNTSNRGKIEDRDIVLVSPPTMLQINHQYAINFNLIPKPHYFFEIRNLNKSELLINSTKQNPQLQSPKQSTVVPSFWNFPPPMQNFSMEPPSLLGLRLSSGREQATQRRRKMPIISRAQRFRQENRVNFQIHERFSSAPIAGFIFDPLQ